MGPGLVSMSPLRSSRMCVGNLLFCGGFLFAMYCVCIFCVKAKFVVKYKYFLFLGVC